MLLSKILISSMAAGAAIGASIQVHTESADKLAFNPAKSPSATDATGRALKEGYVVCIPGSRGANSTITRDGKTIYTGIAPNGLLDLKAAIRYLRYNDNVIPGSAERIITNDTSAGGAMSALMGYTGDRVPDFLKQTFI